MYGLTFGGSWAGATVNKKHTVNLVNWNSQTNAAKETPISICRAWKQVDTERQMQCLGEETTAVLHVSTARTHLVFTVQQTTIHFRVCKVVQQSSRREDALQGNAAAPVTEQVWQTGLQPWKEAFPRFCFHLVVLCVLVHSLQMCNAVREEGQIFPELDFFCFSSGIRDYDQVADSYVFIIADFIAFSRLKICFQTLSRSISEE